MTEYKVKCRHNRSGMALALVVILMLLLSISGLTVIQLGQAAQMRSIESSNDIMARYAADAGAEQAIFLMNRMLEQGAWSEDALPTLSSVLLAGSDADYSVTVTGSAATDFTITSVGRAGEKTRTIRVIARLSNPLALNYAVLAQGGVGLKHNASVKGFNSSDPSQNNLTADIGTLSNKQGSIDIKNGANVNGNVYVGLTDNPEKVVSYKNRSDIKGEIFSNPLPFSLPVISAPSGLSSKGKLTGKNITLRGKDSGTYSSISIDNKGQLRIEEDCVLAVSGNIELKNDAEIFIADAGSLVLYLAGDFDAKNSAGVANSKKIPSKFKLFGTGNNQTIDLKNGSDFYGAVYAPNADMTLHNGGNAFGSFIVNSFEMKNSGNVYYDKALTDVAVTDEAAKFVVVHWEEL